MPSGNNAPKKETYVEFFGLVIFGIIAISLLLWFGNRPLVVSFFYYADLPQYLLIHYLHVDSHLEKSIGGYIYKVLFFHGKNAIDQNSISWAEISTVQKTIGHKLFWVYALVIFFLAYRLFKKMKGGGLLRTFMIKPNKKHAISFIEYQAKVFPMAGAGIGFDPENSPPELLPPLTPFNFMRLHKIRMTKKEGIDEEHLKRLFEGQLGRQWKGFENEPFYMRAFMLLCVTSLHFPRGGTNAGEEKLDVEYGSDSFNNKLANAFYRVGASNEEIERDVNIVMERQIEYKPELVSEINRLINGKYFYSRTAAIGLLAYCGPFSYWGGNSKMIPPVTFQWLMRWDRTAMLALHSVGTRGVKAFVEGAGVVAHYRAEKQTGSMYSVPYVIMAVKEMSRYLTKELVDSAQIHDMEEAEETIKESRRRFSQRGL